MADPLGTPDDLAAHAEGYADAMLPTLYGRGIVLGYLVDHLRGQVTGVLSRPLVAYVEWRARRATRRR